MKKQKIAIAVFIVLLFIVIAAYAFADDKICCYSSVPLSCSYSVNETECNNFIGGSLGAGFPEGNRYQDNPCYDPNKIAAYQQCPPLNETENQKSCSDYNSNESGCLGNTYCDYCSDSNRCIANCMECSSKRYDSNNDRICDAGNLSSGCSLLTTQNACTISTCKWCLSDNSCFTNCTYCSDEKTDSDSNNLCDQNFASLWGYIKPASGNLSENLYYSNLSLERFEGGYYSYTVGQDYSPFGVYYNVAVPVGTYSATLSKTDYYPDTKDIYNLTTGAIRNVNFTMSKKPDMCYKIWPSPAVNAVPIKCSLGINLTWNDECSNDVREYVVLRDNKTIYRGAENHFSDSDISWNKNYTYRVNVTFNNGAKNYTEITANAGNSECNNRCDLDWFCFNNSIRGQCDSKNQFTMQTCIGSFCWKKSAECKSFDACEETGLNENIFGMFYYNFKSECYGTLSNPNYCFYDYSDTTADKCKNCNPSMTCYDYKSQEACEKDSCGATNNICKFSNNTPYYELGIGLCYEEGYKGTDKCSLCSVSSDNLFYSNGCTGNVCELLGSCYANSNESRCMSCAFPKSIKHPEGLNYSNNLTDCTSYSDEYSCTRGRAISINSSAYVNQSNDICELGVCKWINEQCRKDGNDDSTADCNIYGAGTAERKNCEKDTVPPVTTIDYSTKKDINFEGYNLSINATDFGSGSYRTYFCIDQINACYPDTEVQNNKIPLNGQVNGLIDINSTVYLRYFSIDNYSNQESIKSETFSRVDTIKPTAEVVYSVEDSANQTGTSDLMLNISVSEHVRCSDVLLRHGINETMRSILNNREISQGINIKYTNIGYGYYKYTLNCIDDYNNINSTIIDNIEVKKHVIYDAYPKGEHYSADEVSGGISIGFKTSSMLTYACSYNDGANETYFSAPVPSGEDNLYSALIPSSMITSPGGYSYTIRCYENNILADYTVVSFVYDTQQPETMLYYSEEKSPLWPYDFMPLANQSDVYGNITIALYCNDSNFNAQIKEPNCQSITYCIWTGEPNCNPDLNANGDLFVYPLYVHGSNKYYINAYSTDLVGLTSNVSSYNVTIDVDGPGGTIIIE